MRRNNYKESAHDFFMLVKRGQLAIITILVVIVIAAVVALFLFTRTDIITPTQVKSPQAYFRDCLQPSIKTSVDLLAKQGGYSDPQGILLYKGDKIKYLCYTSEFYKTCTIQDPFIKERFDSELAKLLKVQADNCRDQLVAEYQKKGYDVTAGKGEVYSVLSPDKLNIEYTSPITFTKQSTQTFKGLSFSIDTKLYDILMVAQSIMAFEVAYGDSETTLYMQYYPDMIIEKVKLSDGSKVYTITDVVTQDSFRFASRSLSWPPGYGLV